MNTSTLYLYTDHLGSANTTTNDNGGNIQHARYMPFGEVWDVAGDAVLDSTGRGFTGHRENRDLGLTYMNARFYAPGVGRFATADTIVPDPTNPQSYNRYSYVYNNPINLIDPTGHYSCNVSDELKELCIDADLSLDDLGLVHHAQLPLVSPISPISVQPFPELPIDFHAVIFPPGFEAAQNKDNALANFLIENDIDVETVQMSLSAISVGVDALELVFLYFAQPQVSIALGFADAGITTLNCGLAGECFIGQPHPDLPEMVVVNQDVLISALDAAVGSFVPTSSALAYDIGSTSANLIYDIFDVSVVPNSISLGVSAEINSSNEISIGIYVLIYQ